MNKEEQVQYLANVFYIVLADGNTDKNEEKAFERIAQAIGAGYFERRNAQDLAKQDGFDNLRGGGSKGDWPWRPQGGDAGTESGLLLRSECRF